MDQEAGQGMRQATAKRPQDAPKSAKSKFKRVTIQLTPIQLDYLNKQAGYLNAKWDGDISWLMRAMVDKHLFATKLTAGDFKVHNDDGQNLFQIPPGGGRIYFHWGLIEQEAKTDTPFQRWAQALLALRDGEVAFGSSGLWTLPPGIVTKMGARRLAASARAAVEQVAERRAARAAKKAPPKKPATKRLARAK
jgi:hypothetical protein